MSRRITHLDHQPTIREVVDMAKRGVPFIGGWWYGRRTAGGTYILGSRGFQFDDDHDRDSVAITTWGQVVPLSIATPPDFVEEFQKAVDDTKRAAR